MCERLSVVIDAKEITPDDLESLFGSIEPQPEEDISEKKRIENALESFSSKSDAAKHLNMDRSTLYRKMAKYGIPD